MKKIVAGLLILAMLLTFMPVGTVYAGISDIMNVYDILRNYIFDGDDSVLTLILSSTWNYVVEELNNKGSHVTVEDVYNHLKGVMTQIEVDNGSGDPPTLWELIVDESGSGGDDGRLSKYTLQFLIKEALDFGRPIVVSLHDTFAPLLDKNEIKLILGVPGGSSADVFHKLLTLSEKIITMDNGRFVAVGSEEDVVNRVKGKILGLAEDYDNLYDDVEQALIDFDSDMRNALQRMLSELNRALDLGLPARFITDVLDVFGLYKVPTPTPTPTPPPGGGGVVPPPTTTPTPTASPTPDPFETIKEELGKTEEPVNAADLLDEASNLIDEVEDPEEAVNKAADIISTAAQSVDTTDVNVEKALLKVANTALKKVSTVTVEAQATGNTAVASIDDDAAEELLSKIDEVAEKASELAARLEESGVTEKASAVLNIDISSDEPVSEVKAELPAKILNAAAEKGLDKVAVNTGVATIAVPSGAIEVREDSKVTMSAKKVDAAELPPSVAEEVADSPVFDFEITVDGEKVTSFGKYIEVSIPYELKPGENPGAITVFYLRENTDTEDPDDYILENVIGVYDPETKTVKFTTIHFSRYVVKENKVTFSDVGKTTRYGEYIEALAAKGIVVGYDGKYRPGSTFTRAEVCAIVVKTLKLYDEEATCDFEDVKESDWFYKHVASAYKAGIISGRPGNIFDPHARMTRQEVATIVSNALIKIKGKAEVKDADRYLSQYNDSQSILPYAKAPVALLTKYSVMGPKLGKSFRPNSPVTRGEAAQVFYNLLNVN